MPTIKSLLEQPLADGYVQWVGLRPQRKIAMVTPASIWLTVSDGIEGDRYKSSRHNSRQVTLIQAEHLQVIASLLGRSTVEPDLLRRNVLVSGVNLLALIGREFTLGSARLEGTGRCHPCSRMETILGPGGYNVMRGHGGITARVLADGSAAVGDLLKSVQAVRVD